MCVGRSIEKTISYTTGNVDNVTPSPVASNAEGRLVERTFSLISIDFFKIENSRSYNGLGLRSVDINRNSPLKSGRLDVCGTTFVSVLNTFIREPSESRDAARDSANRRALYK